MSQNLKCRSPARGSKYAESKGTLRATIRAVFGLISGTREYQLLHHHKGTPKRMMKETLFTRHRSAREPLMIAKDRKTTLQEIHTMAVNQVQVEVEVQV